MGEPRDAILAHRLAGILGESVCQGKRDRSRVRSILGHCLRFFSADADFASLQVCAGLHQDARAEQDNSQPHYFRTRNRIAGQPPTDSECAGLYEVFQGESCCRAAYRLSLFTTNVFSPKMDHPAASHRLSIGVPATVEHASSISNSSAADRAKWVAELTQAWITLMVRAKTRRCSQLR